MIYRRLEPCDSRKVEKNICVSLDEHNFLRQRAPVQGGNDSKGIVRMKAAGVTAGF
jgi:hypothetical protein